MFPGRYFAARFFAPRYFPEVGAFVPPPPFVWGHRSGPIDQAATHARSGPIVHPTAKRTM